jgi:hypothetical protein
MSKRYRFWSPMQLGPYIRWIPRLAPAVFSKLLGRPVVEAMKRVVKAAGKEGEGE